MTNWKAFPHSAKPYRYSKDALRENWARLHRGDCEPWPEDDQVIEAWQAYHAGDFQRAHELGTGAGDAGHYVAAKAEGIHAVYLVEDEDEQLEIFEAIAQRCEAAQDARPNDCNAFYFHAFALGRYSQGISITKALAQGLGGKIKRSLDHALELQPDHADAHTASGLYHAEIIGKVGKMVGKLTYGATREKALGHLDKALALFPESAITRMEYANGLLLLDGDKAYDKASDLYVAAAEAEPADAMERLDVELAKSELE